MEMKIMTFFYILLVLFLIPWVLPVCICLLGWVSWLLAKLFLIIKRSKFLKKWLKAWWIFWVDTVGPSWTEYL